MNTFAQYNDSICKFITGNSVDDQKNKQGLWHLSERRVSEEKGIYYLSARGCYINGLKFGNWKYTDSAETLLEEATYFRDSLNGFYTLYYDNGVKKIIEYFEYGTPAGTWTYFYPSGKLFIEESYVNGLISGESKRYFETGNIEEISNYKLGEKNGRYLLFNENGNIVEEANFVDDERRGQWKKYYSNSYLKYFVNLNENGYFEGAETYYYPSGKIEKETNYLNNEKNGEQKFYDENGELVKIVIFKNGIPIDTIKF